MKISKSPRHGWEAETHVNLTAPYRLDIRTSRRSGGGVSTFVHVVKVEDQMVCYELFGDFAETVYSDRDARGTEKTIRVQHEAALLLLPALLERVYAFPKYAGKIIKPDDIAA